MPRSPLDQFVDPAGTYADPADDDTGSLVALSRSAMTSSRPSRPRETQLTPEEERAFQEWLQQGHSFHDLRGVWRAIKAMIDGGGNGAGGSARRTHWAGVPEELQRGSSPTPHIAVRATPPMHVTDYNLWGLRQGARSALQGEPPSAGSGESRGLQKGGSLGD